MKSVRYSDRADQVATLCTLFPGGQVAYRDILELVDFGLLSEDFLIGLDRHRLIGEFTD